MASESCWVCCAGMVVVSVSAALMGAQSSHEIRLRCERDDQQKILCSITEKHGFFALSEHSDTTLDRDVQLSISETSTRHGTFRVLSARDASGRERSIVSSLRCSFDEMQRRLQTFLGDPEAATVEVKTAGYFTALFGLLVSIVCAVGAVMFAVPRWFGMSIKAQAPATGPPRRPSPTTTTTSDRSGKYSFQPQWKEELVCTGPGGVLKFEFSMGSPHAYFPTEARWQAAAPSWAKPLRAEILADLEAWCAREKVPLTVTDDAGIH